MKKYQLLSAAIAAACLSTTAAADTQISANIEINTDAVNKDTTTFDQNGRVEVVTASTKTMGDNFVEGKGVIELTTDGGTSIADVYLKMGNSSWDAQVGRFEGVNLFPLGKDVMVEHAGSSVYGANKARGRAGDDGGQLAIHFKPSDAVSVELGTMIGDDDTAGDNGSAISAFRPTVTFAADGFSVTAGMEVLNYDLTAGGSKEVTGYGITTNFMAGDASINLSYASLDDDTANQETNSFAANATMGDFGVGLIYSDDDNNGTTSDVTTAYAAYSMPVLDIDGATMTVAGSVSESGGADATALRLRFNYSF